MKVFALVASITMFAPAAFAGGVPQITCIDGEGFKAVLNIEGGTGIGTLSYGVGEDLQKIEGLDTSFNGTWGAASKSGKVLFVVTPSGEQLVGQLIIDHKTHILSCSEG